jgi:two-component system phosphate regulon sensor histidine kinase PhoR
LEHQTFLLDRMHDGLMRVAANGRVRYANAAAGALFGVRNPIGQSFMRATRDHELQEALTLCLAEGHDERLTVERPDGRLISAVILRVNDDPPEALVMLRDITEVNHLQTLRRDFVANVSHELRTPLATIKILAETLLDLRPDDAEATRYLTQLDGEIDVMTALVRDLLDLSRLESEADALSVGPTDAARIVAEARERMAPIAARRGVRLETELSQPSITLRADERRLQQALVNLVGNAVAHTPAGGTVTLGVREQRDEVSFSVRDTGAGIASAELERVWERFFKADRSRAGAGMGLGLAIVKHIALAHGGAVAATSELGQGSEFTVTVPRRQ